MLSCNAEASQGLWRPLNKGGRRGQRIYFALRKTGTISLAFPFFFFLFIVNNGQERGLDLNWFSDFLKKRIFTTFRVGPCQPVYKIPRGKIYSHPEMEFLDVTVTKDSSLFFMLFTVPSTGGFYRKPYSRKSIQKFRETRKLKSVHE